MVDVAHSYNMNRSTISMILKNKNKDKIMEQVKSAVPMMATIMLKKREKSWRWRNFSVRGFRISISIESPSA